MNSFSLLRWIIPQRIEGDEISYKKSRLIINIGLIIVVLMGLNSIRAFVNGNPASGIMVLASCFLILLSIISLRYTASHIVSGHACLLFIYILLVFISLNYQNPGASPDVVNFSLLVLLAYMFTNTKGGIFWGFLSFIAVIGIWKINAARVGVTYQIPVEKVEANNYTAYLVLTLITLLLGMVYERNNSSSLQLFQVERDKSNQISNDLTVVLGDVKHLMQEVSNCNLSETIEADLEGEFGDLKKSVNDSLELLSGVISQVLVFSDKINIGTNELSTSAQILASGASQQAANLEEISSSMSEIQHRTEANDDNSKQTLALTDKALKVVQQGNNQMELLLNSVKNIDETSQQVSKVVRLIDDIAFQTNLLALNASVEAARAGKYGKGFAVVADEVRNLASRTADAARNTTELINNSIQEINKGVENADQTASILSQIDNSVKGVSDLVNEIAMGSKEQRISITEINKGLTEVNNIVMKNSSVSEQTAASSQELSNQCEQLRQMMGQFRLRLLLET